MKNTTVVFFLFISFSVLLLFANSCTKNKNCKQNNISSSSKTSHNIGKNCITCHTYGGKGEGCFNVAGSLYDSITKAALTYGNVKLYTAPNGEGTLKHKINVDKSGNFYSTDNIDVNGLYPSVTGPDGKTHYMSSPITSGACNSCHGVSTASITAH